jgi:hypothetical protein
MTNNIIKDLWTTLFTNAKLNVTDDIDLDSDETPEPQINCDPKNSGNAKRRTEDVEDNLTIPANKANAPTTNNTHSKNNERFSYSHDHNEDKTTYAIENVVNVPHEAEQEEYNSEFDIGESI